MLSVVTLVDLILAHVKLDILEMAKLAAVCCFVFVFLLFSCSFFLVCLFVLFFCARAFSQPSCSSLHTYLVVNCFVKIMVEHDFGKV